MKSIILLFMISGALVDLIKISLLPRYLLFLWSIFWGIIGGFSIMVFSGISKEQIVGGLNLENFIILEWLELLLMFIFLFNLKNSKRYLKFYPGFMISLPICALSFHILTEFSGYEFLNLAVVTGLIIFIGFFAIGKILRILNVDDKVLYFVSLWCVVINILTLGLL